MYEKKRRAIFVSKKNLLEGRQRRESGGREGKNAIVGCGGKLVKEGARFRNNYVVPARRESEDEVKIDPDIAMNDRRKRVSRVEDILAENRSCQPFATQQTELVFVEDARCSCPIFNSKTTSSSQLSMRSQHKTEFQSRETATHHVLTRLSAIKAMLKCLLTVAANLSALRARSKVSTPQCAQ